MLGFNLLFKCGQRRIQSAGAFKSLEEYWVSSAGWLQEYCPGGFYELKEAVSQANF